MGQLFNDSNWQFGYQAIAGVRYEINALFALDLDYRYLATTESTFRIPNTAFTTARAPTQTTSSPA